MFDTELRLMASLRRLYKTLDDALARNLKQLGISTMDYLILSILESTGPIPMQELREYVLISSGSITYATDRIIKKGLIQKTQDDDDKRRFYVELTKEGSDTLALINKDHLPYISQLLSSYDKTQLDSLSMTINDFRESIEKNK